MFSFREILCMLWLQNCQNIEYKYIPYFTKGHLKTLIGERKKKKESDTSSKKKKKIKPLKTMKKKNPGQLLKTVEV